MSKRKIFRIVWFSLVAVFFVWNWSTFQSRNLPDNTFESDELVDVIETDDEYIFRSKKSVHGFEVIFFPGGLTDPKAYAPLCRRIAEQGFTCHLICMSFRMAKYDYQKISQMFDLNTEKYILGGHSQGAMMAAQYVYENPGKLHGLFLLGTSHPRDISLSHDSIPTLKLYAENDGLASVPEVLENKDKLPTNAKLILIKGGNHSQFGYLGKLLTDDAASISTQVQQGLTLENILELLNDIRKE